jgi:prepilin-type N-terminal cleavage/methylation domain-containing protein
MIEKRSRGVNRPAFTLIELLVVMAIIAILVSLTSAAVMRAMWKIPEVQTSTDIAELGTALSSFMSDYQLSDPPPSKLILREDMAYNLNPTNPNAALELQSLQFLKKVFGKNLGPTDWNGDTKIANPAAGWILEGEQCLIFYVGGIPNTAQIAAGSPPQCQGFSYNNTNPATPGGKRHGPYFQNTQTGRLVPLTAYTLAPNFFVYIDAWKKKTGPMPYAYFSSNGLNNGYSLTDCATIGASPYFSGVAPNLTYMSANTYQIISAGADGAFGNVVNKTLPWNPSSGATGAGADDQASFSSALLKAGQQ